MLKQIEVNGDQVIVGGNGGGLVASRSEPGNWHIVKNGVCDCRGFITRGQCRHVVAVASLADQPALDENPTFALAEATLAGKFEQRRKAVVQRDWDRISAGEDMSFAEWRERRAS